MSNLYRAIPVWRRANATTSVRYTCFENLSEGGFCVLTADFVRLPLDPKAQAYQDDNVLELFIAQELSSRGAWFPSLAEAIQRHDQDFENDWPT
jgi:hypothetical protein